MGAISLRSSTGTASSSPWSRNQQVQSMPRTSVTLTRCQSEETWAAYILPTSGCPTLGMAALS